MIPIKINDSIDDVVIHKFIAKEKILKLMDSADYVEVSNKKLIKTASSDNISANQLIELFTKMLSCLNLKTESNVGDLVNNFMKAANNDGISKNASIKNAERKSEIKIVSKKVKDSHYQVDISKDVIKKNDKKIFMVSCYAKDAYLGRYLIKRNFYYSQDREDVANQSYDELNVKIAAIKDRYYNEIIDVAGIFKQIKTVLDGVISEIKLEEDSLGTTVSR